MCRKLLMHLQTTNNITAAEQILTLIPGDDIMRLADEQGSIRTNRTYSLKMLSMIHEYKERCVFHLNFMFHLWATFKPNPHSSQGSDYKIGGGPFMSKQNITKH